MAKLLTVGKTFVCHLKQCRLPRGLLCILQIKLIAEWKLTDDLDGKDVLGCFEVPLQITS